MPERPEPGPDVLEDRSLGDEHRHDDEHDGAERDQCVVPTSLRVRQDLAEGQLDQHRQKSQSEHRPESALHREQHKDEGCADGHEPAGEGQQGAVEPSERPDAGLVERDVLVVHMGQDGDLDDDRGGQDGDDKAVLVVAHRTFPLCRKSALHRSLCR
jgi:hypothetical protein